MISYTNYSFDPNLGEGLCIFTSFHFPDSGLYLSNGFDFYFDLFWMAWIWKPAISTSTVISSFSEKKKSAVSKTLFFSFHLRCCKNENLWWFSPYPVTTTIIWPTTDRIPHSLIFKRMQIKRIADNIRAFSFLVTNWNKEPDEERIYRWTEFFHNSPVKLWFVIKLIATSFFFNAI